MRISIESSSAINERVSFKSDALSAFSYILPPLRYQSYIYVHEAILFAAVHDVQIAHLRNIFPQHVMQQISGTAFLVILTLLMLAYQYDANFKTQLVLLQYK